MNNVLTIHISTQIASANNQTLAEVRNQVLTEIESQYLRFLLIRHQGSVFSAAESAVVSTSYLRRLIRKRGIDPDHYREKKNRPKILCKCN